MTCEAKCQAGGDQMFCRRCNLRWDADDENPPECKPREEPRRVTREGAAEIALYAKRYREASGR